MSNNSITTVANELVEAKNLLENRLAVSAVGIISGGVALHSLSYTVRYDGLVYARPSILWKKNYIEVEVESDFKEKNKYLSYSSHWGKSFNLCLDLPAIKKEIKNRYEEILGYYECQIDIAEYSAYFDAVVSAVCDEVAEELAPYLRVSYVSLSSKYVPEY